MLHFRILTNFTLKILKAKEANQSNNLLEYLTLYFNSFTFYLLKNTKIKRFNDTKWHL